MIVKYTSSTLASPVLLTFSAILLSIEFLRVNDCHDISPPPGNNALRLLNCGIPSDPLEFWSLSVRPHERREYVKGKKSFEWYIGHCGETALIWLY